jgi:nitroreductase
MIVFWQRLRVYGRIIKAFNGFFYDFRRFYAYSAWKGDMQDSEVRNYHLVKVYHSLEKSMSFKNRNKSSGWLVAQSVLDLLKVAEASGDIGYHDKTAYSVLKTFIETPGNIGTDRANDMQIQLNKLSFSIQDNPGFKKYNIDDFNKGLLADPESFFYSRYSLREFKSEKVDEYTIKRAVSLAMKSPSVCNRQAWHVYHTDVSQTIEKALQYQQGNRGFGQNIPNLMIITTDLKAFMPGQEHYQHWVDGGLFAMSVIYALHSLGVASCCLNWSQSPQNDRLLRSVVDINSSHTIIMMLAIGLPDETNQVCISARRPLKEVYSHLQILD